MNTQLNIISNVDDGFIPETESFTVLKAYLIDSVPKSIPKAALAMAIDLLKQILFRMYKATDYPLLVKRASTNLDECQLFSKHMADSLNDSGWATSTTRNVSCILKRVLLLTSIPPEFVAKIKYVQTKPATKQDADLCAGAKENEIKKKHFQEWATILRDTTNNKSSNSIKAILRFYNKILPKLEIDVNNLQAIDIDHKQFMAIKFDNEYIKSLKLTQPQLRWLKILFVNILDLKIQPTAFTQIIKKKEHLIDDDGSDKHRLTPNELQTLYEQVQGDVRDELIYMLFVTTGMRIGGLVKIRLEHVAEINGATVIAKPSGRTLEKGSKWFTFVINNRVNELMTQWIKNLRPNNGSPYLFPGRCDVPYLKEASVRKRFHTWCKKAGLSGTHLHPHSLRHSYGHLLLEAGNSVHEVSKLLGHSNIATTEMFYLKESSADVAKRANIPWLTKPEKQDTLPKFLVPSGSTQTNSAYGAGAQLKEKQDRERKRRMKNMAKIGGFVVKTSLESVQE